MTTLHSIGAGISTTVMAAAIIGLWSVGGFITGAAYAEDQNKLDTIIDLLTYQQDRKGLDVSITRTEERIQEVQLYIDADPASQLAGARRANLNRLRGLKAQYERDKDALDKIKGRK